MIGWGVEDRTRIWLEAGAFRAGWRMDVLAEPLDNPRPELFLGQQIFVWTGKKLTRRQTEQFAHWHEQGFSITLHGQS